MLRTRVIPALLLRDESLVKGVRFGSPQYVGDPCNTVRIFNELEVDELLFLDITATRERRRPNFTVLHEIANECFMPLAYGGGISSLEDAKAVFKVGIEKIALNAAPLQSLGVVTEIARHFGSQAVIGAIDVKRNWLGKYRVYCHWRGDNSQFDPIEWARQLERAGAGEILLTSVDREGTWSGFDVDLVRQVSAAVGVPVIAHGGAGTVEHIGSVVREGGASAVALGSMVVFQKQGMGVLISFPDRRKLETFLT